MPSAGMPSFARSVDQNHLLAALPRAEFGCLTERLEWVPMALGDVLHESGQSIRYAYFPTSCVVSLHYVTESGASTEIAGVGHEGMVGISLFLGGDTMPGAAAVQASGYAYRVESRYLQQEFSRGGMLMQLLLRYTQCLMTQMYQAAACNRHHSVEQRLSRWLLDTLDRIPSGELIITQDQVASALGVRREGVTEAVGKLRASGLISCRRGHISVLNRKGLEALSCECYAAVKQEIKRLTLTDHLQRNVGRSAV